MGVRKQALSTWLNSDAVPAPQVVVRLARGMGRPVREVMTAAGFAPGDDRCSTPLMPGHTWSTRYSAHLASMPRQWRNSRLGTMLRTQMHLGWPMRQRYQRFPKPAPHCSCSYGSFKLARWP